MEAKTAREWSAMRPSKTYGMADVQKWLANSVEITRGSNRRIVVVYLEDGKVWLELDSRTESRKEVDITK